MTNDEPKVIIAEEFLSGLGNVADRITALAGEMEKKLGVIMENVSDESLTNERSKESPYPQYFHEMNLIMIRMNDELDKCNAYLNRVVF